METETTRSEGKLLLEYLREHGISKKEICAKLNITLPMLSYHCRKQMFSGSFKSKLNGLGIELFEGEKQLQESPYDYITELQEEVRLLTEVIAIQKQFITHLTQNCKHGHCLNFVFEDRKSLINQDS